MAEALRRFLEQIFPCSNCLLDITRISVKTSDIERVVDIPDRNIGKTLTRLNDMIIHDRFYPNKCKRGESKLTESLRRGYYQLGPICGMDRGMGSNRSGARAHMSRGSRSLDSVTTYAWKAVSLNEKSIYVLLSCVVILLQLQ